MSRQPVTPGRSALLSALGSALLTAAAQYLGLTKPARDGYDLAEKLLEHREAQVERRERRIEMLEEALERCEGRPIARGATPAAAARAARSGLPNVAAPRLE